MFREGHNLTAVFLEWFRSCTKNAFPGFLILVLNEFFYWRVPDLTCKWLRSVVLNRFDFLKNEKNEKLAGHGLDLYSSNKALLKKDLKIEEQGRNGLSFHFIEIFLLTLSIFWDMCSLKFNLIQNDYQIFLWYCSFDKIWVDSERGMVNGWSFPWKYSFLRSFRQVIGYLDGGYFYYPQIFIRSVNLCSWIMNN